MPPRQGSLVPSQPAQLLCPRRVVCPGGVVSQLGVGVGQSPVGRLSIPFGGMVLHVVSPVLHGFVYLADLIGRQGPQIGAFHPYVTTVAGYVEVCVKGVQRFLRSARHQQRGG